MTCHKPSYKSTPSPDCKDTSQQRKNAALTLIRESVNRHMYFRGRGGGEFTATERRSEIKIFSASSAWKNKAFDVLLCLWV